MTHPDTHAAEILKLDAERLTAMKEADVATLRRIYHSELVYTHSSGRTEGLPPLLAAIADGRTRYTALQTQNVVVTRVGSTAIATGAMLMDVTVGGVAKSLRNQFQTVWVEQGGAWRLLAVTSTPITH
ncbi:MAG: nuclear transport factor 2 family protein [Rhodoferax sp.]